MANIKYKASDGHEFNLLDFDYAKLEKANFHKVKWNPEVTEKQFGTVINRFTKNAQAYDCTFKFKGDPKQRKQQIDDFLFHTEFDIASQNPGYLYWDNQYIAAYFISNDTHPVDSGMTWTEIQGQFYCAFPFWMEDKTYHIDPSSFAPLPQREDNKGYPSDRGMSYVYTYSYPYAGLTGTFYMNTSFGADYHIEVYGPIADYFEMTVNGNMYKVNYPLRSGQKLIIDSRDYLKMSERCYVLNENGTTTNAFDYRDPQSSLFERFIGYEATMSLDKPYEFDITLFLERSAPI